MRILITGGCGFIGQHLAALLSADHDLVALDLLTDQVHLDPEVARQRFPGEVVVGDVADADIWAGLPTVDAVVHLAAETGTAQSMYEQDRYRRVNIEGTRLAGLAASRWGASLVSLSSRAVYGEGRYRTSFGEVTFGARDSADAVPEASREDDRLVPVSVYGQTKVDAELALAQVANGVPVTILRPQNVVGHGQALHNPYTGVLAAFLARLREGKPLQIYGDGHETRDFVHVSDVAAVIAWALGRTATGEPLVLNVGTGTRTTLVDIATHAIAAAPHGGSFEHVEVKRAGDIEHACADLSRLRSVGAPEPKTSSADAIADFITRSWAAPGADSSVWDDALDQLRRRGLTR
ncbi:NAD-dependent epimerase/dehydratase family protein [Propionibacteriaceae bacterium Y1923]|uniref:NAD-dependent epimerase/dehydratase family protein n=1 Tax=Aestuariimicrobium sp. Y1814 TaxID=3418742 RepID=UPI003C1897FE